jgi:AraC-like DNA-binding protein
MQCSLTDVGELLGFAESSVFTRSFRRWFGLTPSQWRAPVRLIRLVATKIKKWRE